MLYLLLTVLLSVALLICFKLFAKWHINTFQAIVFNYITCVAIGTYMFSREYELPLNPLLITGDWLPYAMVTGLLFISTFHLIGVTTQSLGMSVASVATKISMAIPIAFNLLIFKTHLAEYNGWNYIGMFLSLIAVILCSLPSRQNELNQTSKNWLKWLLPFVIFVMSGLIDTLINYSSLRFLEEKDEMPFIIFAFGTAGAIGLLVTTGSLMFGGKFHIKSVLGGIILGIPNYFSLFFLIKTLERFNADGAFVFPLLNIGIIVISALSALFLFKEKMNKWNYIGLSVALLSIFLISYTAFL